MATPITMALPSAACNPASDRMCGASVWMGVRWWWATSGPFSPLGHSLADSAALDYGTHFSDLGQHAPWPELRVWGQGLMPDAAIELATPGSMGSGLDPRCPFLAWWVTSSRLCISAMMPLRGGSGVGIAPHLTVVAVDLGGSSRGSRPCLGASGGSMVLFTQDRSTASGLSATS